MNVRDGNLPSQAAEDAVFENLGLTRADLGMDADTGSGNEDLGSGNDDQGSGFEGDLDLGGDDGDGHQQQQPQRGQQQQPQRGQQQDRVSQTPFAQNAEVKPDKKGNLVNAQGQIVARAGKEARLYQDLHKARGQVQGYERQVNDVKGRLNKAIEIGRGFHQELVSLKAQGDAIKQFGLDQSEHLTALRLFKELRDNPAAAIKNILTRAATNGINMTELGLTPGGVDTKSLMDVVKETINQAVNPLRESTEAAKRAKEASDREAVRLSQIQNDVSEFFTANPDAREHLPVFTNVAAKFPGMSLGEIWARIQLQLARNPQQRRVNSQGGNRQRSLPNGRPAPMNGGGDDIAPVTDSYDAIIHRAMREAGMTN